MRRLADIELRSNEKPSMQGTGRTTQMASKRHRRRHFCEYILFRPLVTVINVIKSILFDVYFLLLFNYSDRSKSGSFPQTRISVAIFIRSA